MSNANFTLFREMDKFKFVLEFIWLVTISHIDQFIIDSTQNGSDINYMYFEKNYIMINYFEASYVLCNEFASFHFPVLCR